MDGMMASDAGLADEQYCYLTTTGRRTGRPHTIEIWFGLAGRTLYMLSGAGSQMPDGTGARADWVRNLQREPQVEVRIGESVYQGTARVVPPGGEEDSLARRLLLDKYQPASSDNLTSWGRSSLPVAVDLD
jgi:deazaflavin-dependent oxidoreductase (nitroreductase family)